MIGTAERVAAAPRRLSVWIVNQYADGPDRPAPGRHFDFARRLVAEGYSVTIFAAAFSHVTGRDERLRGWRLFGSTSFEGVRFVWLKTFPYRGNTWRRQVNMLSFAAVFLAAQARFAAPDTIVGSTVHPFAAFGAWLAATIRRARFVYEIRDLWPQTLVDIGALRDGSPGERLLRAIEALLVRRASTVVTVLPGMRDYLDARGLPSHHVVYVPNGVDLRAFDDRSTSRPGESRAAAAQLEAIRALRSEGRFVLGYVGSFGRVNELDVVIRAARIADRREPGQIGLVLVGDGPERPGLERLAERSRAITVCQSVPRRCVPIVLRALDGAVIHLMDSPVFRYGISPNKLFEYMAAELPIVFACRSAYDPVAAAGAGISVPPDDPERIADAMLELAHSRHQARERMGAAGRAFVSREHQLDALAARLAAVVGRCTPAGGVPAPGIAARP